jgi:hypothetical protein
MQSGEFKYDNCKHRSNEKRTTIVHRCPCDGGNYEDSGYDCHARSIFKITPEICQYCWAFENK